MVVVGWWVGRDSGCECVKRERATFAATSVDCSVHVRQVDTNGICHGVFKVKSRYFIVRCISLCCYSAKYGGVALWMRAWVAWHGFWYIGHPRLYPLYGCPTTRTSRGAFSVVSFVYCLGAGCCRRGPHSDTTPGVIFRLWLPSDKTDIYKAGEPPLSCQTHL